MSWVAVWRWAGGLGWAGLGWAGLGWAGSRTRTKYRQEAGGGNVTQPAGQPQPADTNNSATNSRNLNDDFAIALVLVLYKSHNCNVPCD